MEFKSHDQRTLDRVRAAAKHGISALTVADVQSVMAMAMHGDLIHVDEVPAHVRQSQLEDYGTALAESLRSARAAA